MLFCALLLAIAADVVLIFVATAVVLDVNDVFVVVVVVVVNFNPNNRQLVAS